MTDLYERLRKDPLSLLDSSYDDLFKFSREQIETLQLEGVRDHFAKLRPGIAMLDRLATEQGIDEIRTLDDVVPLLFPHTFYKSYPPSYIERNRYDKLTRWLAGLTTVDISNVDARGIDSIDAWLDLLDAETPLLVSHTSGTTGKLSFIPRTKEQWRQSVALTALRIRDVDGPNSGPDVLKDHRPIVFPGYRHGAGAAQRGTNLQVEMIAGNEEDALFMYPDSRFSADVASLSGRLRSAEARGEQGALDIPPALMRRREELIELERRRPEDLRKFFDDAQSRFGGRDVLITAVWSILFDWANEGLKRGIKQVFGPRSVLVTGGGKKGADLPDDWRDTVLEFLGFDNFYEMYGSSENMLVCPRCEEDHYHIPPLLVPFVLDPATGEALPRIDGTVGRFASLDLLANTYWAGLITGDEVTISGWQSTCGCGRTGPYLLPEIRRYSEMEGGDDRIMCAGAPEAHDQALAFLAELSS